MSLLKTLKAIFAGSGGSGSDAYSLYYYVRCHRCREVIKARVDLRNELSSEYGDADTSTGYYYRKVLIGSNRCFQPIEVAMSFDSRRRMISQEAKGGDLVTEQEYEEQAAAGGESSQT